jgi:hypothetical protein
MVGTKAAVITTLTSRRIVPPMPLESSFWKMNTSSPSGAPSGRVSSRLSPNSENRCGQRMRRSGPGSTESSQVWLPAAAAMRLVVSRISRTVQRRPSGICPNRAAISSLVARRPTTGTTFRASVTAQAVAGPSGASAGSGSAVTIHDSDPSSRPATSARESFVRSMPAMSAESARAERSR